MVLYYSPYKYIKKSLLNKDDEDETNKQTKAKKKSTNISVKNSHARARGKTKQKKKIMFFFVFFLHFFLLQWKPRDMWICVVYGCIYFFVLRKTDRINTKYLTNRKYTSVVTLKDYKG